MCSLIYIISCSTDNRFDFDVKYPENIKVKKDSTLTLYIKIFNLNNDILFFTDIKTSCQCVILSKRKLLINPKENDSIKIKLFGSSLGEITQSVIFSNDSIKKFKLININYEVTN